MTEIPYRTYADTEVHRCDVWMKEGMSGIDALESWINSEIQNADP